MGYFTGMVFSRKPFVVYQTVIIVFCRNTVMGFTPKNEPFMCLMKKAWWVLSIPHNVFCTMTLMFFFRDGFYKKTISGTGSHYCVF